MPDHERAAERLVERGQRRGEVGAAHLPGPGPQQRVDDEERHDLVRGAGREQRRVVRQAQVAPEPHHRGARHRSTLPAGSWAATSRRVGHNVAVSDLIDTTEMYLRTIYELVEEGIVPLRARIAERLHQSGPTVSQTVARMERDGLLTVEGDRHLELTEEGSRLAIRVMRKHRLAERLLTDVIGLPWELVHAEACRWEHVMSEAVERRLIELLDQPTESPYGNPIPGLDELGAEVGEEFMEGVVSARLGDRRAEAGCGSGGSARRSRRTSR